MSRLRVVSLVSLVYDAAVGIAMLAARPLLASVFGVPLPQPPIHADLNGVFLLAVAAGYLIPFRDPVGGRGYLWVMGPCLKGAGACLFVVDYLVRSSPASFLMFAASDGAMALVTWWALATTARRRLDATGIGGGASTSKSARPRS